MTTSEDYQTSAYMTAALTGLVAAAAEAFLPLGGSSTPVMHAATVGTVAAAAVGVAWISVDAEQTYDETIDSLYMALGIAAVTAGLVSYAASRMKNRRFVSALLVGAATGGALLVSRHERDSGLSSSDQWSRFQYYRNCPAGTVWCSTSCCPKKDCVYPYGCVGTSGSSSGSASGQSLPVQRPYLELPSGGWDRDDLTDSKRPRGWMVDKYCRAHEYVNCPGCQNEPL